MFMTKTAVIKGTGWLHTTCQCPQVHGVDCIEIDPRRITHKKCHYCFPSDQRQLEQREINNARKK